MSLWSISKVKIFDSDDYLTYASASEREKKKCKNILEAIKSHKNISYFYSCLFSKAVLRFISILDLSKIGHEI